jgi:hypothetical protein
MVQPASVPVVRVLRLRRRRTNVPWIYSLYHADRRPRRRRVREPSEGLEEELLLWDGEWGEDWEGDAG